MNLRRQSLDSLCEGLDGLGQLRVLIHKIDQHGRLFGHQRLTFLAGAGNVLAMQGVSFGVGLIAVGLAGLRE
jgi:hypothetical protein